MAIEGCGFIGGVIVAIIIVVIIIAFSVIMPSFQEVTFMTDLEKPQFFFFFKSVFVGKEGNAYFSRLF